MNKWKTWKKRLERNWKVRLTRFVRLLLRNYKALDFEEDIIEIQRQLVNDASGKAQRAADDRIMQHYRMTMGTTCIGVILSIALVSPVGCKDFSNDLDKLTRKSNNSTYNLVRFFRASIYLTNIDIIELPHKQSFFYIYSVKWHLLHY